MIVPIQRIPIYCCTCQREVDARLTNGAEIYPSRQDLAKLLFWKCDRCKMYVGCHKDEAGSTRPLGVIATAEIKKARKAIHRLLDPLWQNKLIKRGKAYAYITHRIGYQYHTAEVKDIDEARKVYKIILELKQELLANK